MRCSKNESNIIWLVERKEKKCWRADFRFRFASTEPNLFNVDDLNENSRDAMNLNDINILSDKPDVTCVFDQVFGLWFYYIMWESNGGKEIVDGGRIIWLVSEIKYKDTFLKVVRIIKIKFILRQFAFSTFRCS